MTDKIDYRIYGEDLQFIQVELDQGESVVSEVGALMYMDYGIEMDTIIGDGSKSGIMGTLLKSAKRAISGDGLFMMKFTNKIPGRKQVSLAAPYPGKIVPIDLSQIDGDVLCQKDAFLCAAKGVSIGVAFQKRILAGFFGGEGFILQRLSGDGMSFVHAGGTLLSRDLREGEVIYVDTGCVVGFQSSVDFDIHTIRDMSTMFFGNEGMFLAKLKGPGKVWLQSMPFSKLSATVIHRYISGQK